MISKSKNRKRLFRIVLAVVLALLVVAVIAGPTFAALVWEHKWDHRTVLFEIPKGPGFNARSEGHTGWLSVEGTKVADNTYSCAGSMSARAYLYATGNEKIRVRIACLRVTPTRAPTMKP